MLATLVIGLREGLEASLIVGIIAAFLHQNGKSLAPMWVGVALAVALSIAVGVGLDLVEQALPQAAQEAMETVIGAIAIFFVTGMIAWMNAHARDMKRQLEAETTEALSHAGAYALASMAFLAVLKEGFETSVFLLATFSAAQSAALAAAGAIIGLALAVAIGWGIYVGGVKVNLSKFFRLTGAFLILVAAGLVITSLRTAHEAGWLNAGQQPTINLAWLVAPGSIQSAMITGVLGIPADPRRIEAIGWFAYLLPVSLFIYWPPSRRPSPATAIKLRFAFAAAAAIVALALALAYPVPRAQIASKADLVLKSDASGSGGSGGSPIGFAQLDLRPGAEKLNLSFNGSNEAVSIPLPQDARHRENHGGVDASAWSIDRQSVPAARPATLTVDQIVGFSGGRIPVGLNPSQHPGPFKADWSINRSLKVSSVGDLLLDASERSVLLVALSGGGLQTPRTVVVQDAGKTDYPSAWAVSNAYRSNAASALNKLEQAQAEREFWAVELPIALGFLCIFFLVSAWRARLRFRRQEADCLTASFPETTHQTHKPSSQGVSHVAH